MIDDTTNYQYRKNLKSPEFFQEEDFRVVLYRNLAEERNETKDETKDETKELSERQIFILNLIKDNGTITQEEMTQKTVSFPKIG